MNHEQVFRLTKAQQLDLIQDEIVTALKCKDLKVWSLDRESVCVSIPCQFGYLKISLEHIDPNK